MITCRMVIAVTTVAITAWMFSVPVAAREQLDEAVILIATPELRDRLYGASVLIATPIGNGHHIGFILNHPTQVKLSQMFPEHAPSKKVTDPIFLGGPANVEALFALVQRTGRAAQGQVKVAADLYLEIERDKVDRVIEKEHARARFFAGVVVWQRGELEAEIRNDFWFVQDADASLVLRKSTNGMWEELVKRFQRNKNAITASNPLFLAGDMAPAPQLRE
jgi:putative transcriptional regulator